MARVESVSVSSHNPDGEGGSYAELWEICAGTRVYVPRIEEKVYYFLQGHMEQIQAYINEDDIMEMPIYSLPSKIPCKVVHVHLKAEPYTDEVFAQITLLPLSKQDEQNWQVDNFNSAPTRTRSRVFSKILTTSDTSTHGGLSVPKRPADECLPPLDMTKDPPVQELIAKDLHGTEWCFRHIFRGSPKRHLLTGGWSTFMSSKKLVAGDTCFFVRGENGELHVGVRRAKDLQSNAPESVISGCSMQHGILASAFHAISTGTMFTVYYRPWTSPSEYLVPFNQYIESSKMDFSVGTRVRLKHDGEEYPEKRCVGTIVGVEDHDSVRWPGSEWRCLEVQWDDENPGGIVLPERVSPWNIEPVGLTKEKNSFDSPRQKRARLQRKNSSSRVLQSQESKKTGSRAFCSGNVANMGVSFISYGASGDGAVTRSLSVSNICSSGNSESQGSLAHPCMVFGVNLVTTPQLELPSPQVTTEAIRPSELSKARCKDCCYVSNRSCTKVLKHGAAVGRSVELARFNDHEGLIRELDTMFDFDGSLIEESSGWRVMYMDRKGSMRMIRDCPWKEFLSVVQRLFIYPEAEKLRPILV